MEDLEDSIEEELQIQDESSRPPSVLSSETFLQPISAMCRQQTLAMLPPSAKISEAISLMQTRRIGGVIIVVEGKLAGIVTERDVLMKVVGSEIDVNRDAVEKIMTHNPEALMLDDQLAYLLNTMRVGGFRHVPIVDQHNRPIHLISVRDVLAYIVDHFTQEIINIPSQPFRGTPQEYG